MAFNNAGLGQFGTEMQMANSGGGGSPLLGFLWSKFGPKDSSPVGAVPPNPTDQRLNSGSQTTPGASLPDFSNPTDQRLNAGTQSLPGLTQDSMMAANPDGLSILMGM